MIPDYHMHLESDETTAPCPYTVERVAIYADAARQAGLPEFGISEHGHRFVEFRRSMEPLFGSGFRQHPQVRQWLMREFRESLERYAGAIVEARRQGLPVRLGVEVDYVPGQEEAIREAVAQAPWDYVIGSVHFLDGECIDCGPEIAWPGADVDRVWQRYYEVMAQAAASGLFDVISHPDLPKKFGHRAVHFPQEAFDKFLQAARARGVAVEVNTAGLRKPVHEIYPGLEILRRMVRAGLDVHVGSDAHDPKEVGAGFTEAVSWMKAAGVERVVRWRGRAREYAAL
ncbi:MAG: histidinol-phosphatase [Bacillota bacterium]